MSNSKFTRIINYLHFYDKTTNIVNRNSTLTLYIWVTIHIICSCTTVSTQETFIHDSRNSSKKCFLGTTAVCVEGLGDVNTYINSTLIVIDEPQNLDTVLIKHC